MEGNTMTLKELVNATDYDVYLRSMWETRPMRPETNTAASNLLLGCSNIANLSVSRFIIEPEDLALYALIDMPVNIMNAIYAYNRMEF
jgi:hypothetical protein